MRMFMIDPDAMTVSPTAAVDPSNYRQVQKAIGGCAFELVKPFPRVQLYVDEKAKLRSQVPARFLVPREGREPISLFGCALLVLEGNRGIPEIVFPKERRVTSLDQDFRTLGYFVNVKAGNDPSNLNFQAILSDERFVAATRVVLATFEANVLNACPSHDWPCPQLELEIDSDHIGQAMDLYDEVLDELGAP